MNIDAITQLRAARLPFSIFWLSDDNIKSGLLRKTVVAVIWHFIHIWRWIFLRLSKHQTQHLYIWISYWTETSCVQSFSVAIALSLDLRNITQVTSFKNKPLFLTLLLLFFVTFLKRTKISRGELWKKLLIIIIINTFWLFLQLLVSVGLEDYHLICVWNWKKGKILASTRGHTDRVSYHD